jgi:hypothetical protein
MHYNRDEFMLLSRGGRVPPAVRAGPPGRDPLLGPGGALVGEPWLLQALSAAVAGLLRHARRAAPAQGSARVQSSAGRAPASGYADPEAYLELEFAVGFAAEDEPWLHSSQ